MTDRITREDALSLLLRKAEELGAMGEERYPRRSDFAEAEVVAIKAFLGPWPRALEAAGLKPPRESDRLMKNRARRERARAARRAEREGDE